MKVQAQQMQDDRVYHPIERPSITKEEAVNIRLTSTREVLGLQLDAKDRVNRRWTNEGMLKDKSWKLLLVGGRLR
jgi:hypothetical protein